MRSSLQRLDSALYKSQWKEAKKALHEAGSNPNVFLSTDNLGNIPLYTALGKHAPQEIILDLIDACEHAAFVIDDLGNTCLHWAARFSAPVEIVQVLIQKKPPLLDQENEAGTTPRDLLLRKFSESAVLTMEEAATKFSSIRHLVSPKAVAIGETKDLNLHTALYREQWGKARDIMNRLLQNENHQNCNSKNINKNQRILLAANSMGNTALYIAMGKHAPQQLILDLITHASPKVLHIVDDYGNNAAHWAARFNAPPQVMHTLIQEKPSLLYQRNKSGTTPREVLLRKMDQEVVFAMEKSATHVATVSNLQSPRKVAIKPKNLRLHSLLYQRQWEAAEALLKSQQQSQPNVAQEKNFLLEKDSMGSIPLYIAVQKHAPLSLIQDLIGACEESVLVLDEEGNNILHWSAMHDTPQNVVDWFMEKQPLLLDQRNKWGKTPLDCGLHCQDGDDMNLLVQKAAAQIGTNSSSRRASPRQKQSLRESQLEPSPPPPPPQSRSPSSTNSSPSRMLRLSPSVHSMLQSATKTTQDTPPLYIPVEKKNLVVDFLQACQDAVFELKDDGGGSISGNKKEESCDPSLQQQRTALSEVLQSAVKEDCGSSSFVGRCKTFLEMDVLKCETTLAAQQEVLVPKDECVKQLGPRFEAELEAAPTVSRASGTFQSEVDAKHEHKDDATERITALETQLVEKDNLIAQLEQEKRIASMITYDFQVENGTLEKQLKEKDEWIAQLDQEKSSAKMVATESRTEKDANQRQLKEKDEVIAQLEQEKDDALQRHLKGQNELIQLEQEKNNVSQKQLKEKDEMIAQLEQEKRSANAVATDYKVRNDALDAQLNKKEQLVTLLEQENRLENVIRSDCKLKSDFSERQLQEKQELILQLEQRIDIMVARESKEKREISALVLQVAERDDKITELEQRITSEKHQYEQHLKDVEAKALDSNFSGDSTDTAVTMVSLEAHEEVLRQVKELEKENTALHSSLSMLRKQIPEKENEIAKLKESSRADQIQFEKSQEESLERSMVLEGEHIETCATLSLVKEQLAEKEAELATLQNNSKAKSAEFDQIHGDLFFRAKEFEGKYVESNAMLSVLIEELSEREAEIAALKERGNEGEVVANPLDRRREFRNRRFTKSSTRKMWESNASMSSLRVKMGIRESLVACNKAETAEFDFLHADLVKLVEELEGQYAECSASLSLAQGKLAESEDKNAALKKRYSQAAAGWIVDFAQSSRSLAIEETDANEVEDLFLNAKEELQDILEGPNNDQSISVLRQDEGSHLVVEKTS